MGLDQSYILRIIKLKLIYHCKRKIFLSKVLEEMTLKETTHGVLIYHPEADGNIIIIQTLDILPKFREGDLRYVNISNIYREST